MEFLLIVLKKNTSAAPRAVTNQVNRVADNACSTGEKDRNHTVIIFFLENVDDEQFVILSWLLYT